MCKRAVAEIKSSGLINISGKKLDNMEPIEKEYRMNLLDEATKKALDDGEVVLLDGGYIVLTPETLFQTVQGATLETISDITEELSAEKQANDSSINQGCKCHFCGKESDFPEYAVTISGGYDIDHDMETVTLEVCAECLETMLAAVN